MTKKTNVFREGDTKYFKEYLTEAIRQMLKEQDDYLTVKKIADEVFKLVQQGVKDMDLEDISASDVDIYQDKNSRAKIVRIDVPTVAGRQELSVFIKQVLLDYFNSNEIKEIYSTSDLVIGYRVKSVVKIHLKPKRGAGVLNKGDVAEGILGASLAAGFISGQTSFTMSQVEDLLGELDAQPNTNERGTNVSKKLTKELKRDDGTVDKITLDVRLAKRNFDDLMDRNKRMEVQTYFKSSVAYANSGLVFDAATSLAVDGESSHITVLSDGVSQQKGTKVDVRIFVDGKEVPLALISLKAGATKQLGQAGNKWSAMETMFGDVFGVRLDKSLEPGWNDMLKTPRLRNAKNIKKLAYEIYEDAYEKIKNYLSGNDPEQEVEFFRTFARGVRKQATLAEEGVKLVQLSGDTFKVLDFDILEDVLTKIDLDVTLQREVAKGRGGKAKGISPKIIVLDKDSGARLISVRPKVEGDGKVIRHYVEKEDGLVQLINIVKREEQKQEEV